MNKALLFTWKKYINLSGTILPNVNAYARTNIILKHKAFEYIDYTSPNSFSWNVFKGTFPDLCSFKLNSVYQDQFACVCSCRTLDKENNISKTGKAAKSLWFDMLQWIASTYYKTQLRVCTLFNFNLVANTYSYGGPTFILHLFVWYFKN